MLTYDLSAEKGSIYKALYRNIKIDIHNGKLESGMKMPSKRALAKNLGISTITVENAYDQLIAEGYLNALPRKGYFVAQIDYIDKINTVPPDEILIKVPEEESYQFDFSSNAINEENLPVAIWMKLTRELCIDGRKKLLSVSPAGGVTDLREAIATHLYFFRGINVDPGRIIVGAGTECLYEVLIKLLGKDGLYYIEDPGYGKIARIYESNDVAIKPVAVTDTGIDISQLTEEEGKVLHISPNHNFPTGITMPLSARYNALSWASKSPDRYIIEDDYDSEFRYHGRPIPTLLSIDTSEKVIYMNTFSKTLLPAIRISYMVLPNHLVEKYYKEFSFYTCTVSVLEQHTLAKFIMEGYFERHINRMRLKYGKKRAQIMNLFHEKFTEDQCAIYENGSGLHFMIELKTDMSDREIQQKLKERSIRISPISDYFYEPIDDHHRFLVNYSNIGVEELDEALSVLKETVFGKEV